MGLKLMHALVQCPQTWLYVIKRPKVRLQFDMHARTYSYYANSKF